VKKCLLVAVLSAIIGYLAVNGSLALIDALLRIPVGLFSDVGILAAFFIAALFGAYQASIKGSL
jgi:hypothetical protein